MNRFVLKLSGEVLSGGKGRGVDDDFLDRVAGILGTIKDTQLVIVIGAGNFWRGRQTERMNKVAADHMGMLATVMNSIALADALNRNGVKCQHFSAFRVDGLVEKYSVEKAEMALESGAVVIVSGGTGSPFFTTDSGAALRAVELAVDKVLLAKSVDGVYDKDPDLHSDAVRFDTILAEEAIARRLKVMDLTAMAICMENGIDIHVFGLDVPENIARATKDDTFGTLVRSQKNK